MALKDDIDGEEASRLVQEYLEKGGDEAKKTVKRAMQRAGQKWLTDQKFNEQFQEAIDMARETAQNDEDGTIMTFMLYGRRYDLDNFKGPEKETWALMPVFMADWPAGEPGFDKNKLMKGLGAKFAEQFPGFMLVNVVQTSEAWMSERSVDDPQEDLAPSESPNRMEIVMVSATSMDNRSSIWSAEMVRDDAGKVVNWKPKFQHKHSRKDTDDDTKGFQNNLAAYIYMGHGEYKKAHGNKW
jgi:hypothetical protein